MCKTELCFVVLQSEIDIYKNRKRAPLLAQGSKLTQIYYYWWVTRRKTIKHYLVHKRKLRKFKIQQEPLTDIHETKLTTRKKNLRFSVSDSKFAIGKVKVQYDTVNKFYIRCIKPYYGFVNDAVCF